jgi:CheY-like chemotaxis protein
MKKDFDVGIAMSGKEALKQMQANTPDLVITDLFMDGMQLMEAIHHTNIVVKI